MSAGVRHAGASTGVKAGVDEKGKVMGNSRNKKAPLQSTQGRVEGWQEEEEKGAWRKGSWRLHTEAVAAVQAAVVVQDVLIDHFAQRSANGAARGAAVQDAQDGAGQRAQGGAWRPGCGPSRQAHGRAAHGGCGAAGCACQRAQGGAGFLAEIVGIDLRALALRTIEVHGDCSFVGVEENKGCAEKCRLNASAARQGRFF